VQIVGAPKGVAEHVMRLQLGPTPRSGYASPAPARPPHYRQAPGRASPRPGGASPGVTRHAAAPSPGARLTPRAVVATSRHHGSTGPQATPIRTPRVALPATPNGIPRDAAANPRGEVNKEACLRNPGVVAGSTFPGPALQAGVRPNSPAATPMGTPRVVPPAPQNGTPRVVAATPRGEAIQEAGVRSQGIVAGTTSPRPSRRPTQVFAPSSRVPACSVVSPQLSEASTALRSTYFVSHAGAPVRTRMASPRVASPRVSGVAPGQQGAAKQVRVIRGPAAQKSEKQRLDELLMDHTATARELHQLYSKTLQVAKKSVMKPTELLTMQRLACAHFGISVHVLPEELLPNLFGRFDFEGTGTLESNEAMKLFTRMLLDFRQKKYGPLREIEVPYRTLSDFGLVFERELGRGGQGVMKLYRNVAGQARCVKFYDKRDSNAGGLAELKEEFRIMQEVTSPHVARTFDVFQDRSFFYLVNEPYFGGDLTRLVRNAMEHNVKPTENWWKSIFVQALSGLNYLHENCIMHCDIKEPNIMVTNEDFERPSVVLIDFGLSTVFAGEGISGGTPGYVPPETIDSGVWYPKGDTFSMGVVMFQLVTGRVPRLEDAPPYREGLFTHGVLEEMKKGHDALAFVRKNILSMSPPFQRIKQPQLRDLLQRMLDKNRRTRLKVKMALKHEWFQTVGEDVVDDDVVEALTVLGQHNAAQEAVMVKFMKGLNLAECRRLNDAFEAADKDHSGALEMDEARALLIAVGVRESQMDVVLDALVDPDTREVSYKRFITGLLKDKALADRQTIRSLFDDLDKDRSGALSKEELRTLVQQDLLDIHDQAELDKLFDEMDVDKDGQIDFDEFERVIIGNGTVRCRDESKEKLLVSTR